MAGFIRKSKGPRCSEAGMSLIELMIASVVLVTALLALVVVAAVAVGSNSRSRTDTTSTMLAQMVMEHIASRPPNDPGLPFTITDDSGAARSISAAPGAGAPLTAAGDIDFSAAPVPNYSMQYVVKDANGLRRTYDIRWNIRSILVPPTATVPFTSVVTVAARPLNASNDLRRFAIPVNLRRIAGAR